MQHVSDLHLKFAIRPSMADIQSATAEIRRGKKKKKKKPQDENTMVSSSSSSVEIFRVA